MPTPDAWRENLERISKIAAAKPEEETASQTADRLDNAMLSLSDGCNQLADRLIGILKVLPEETHRDAISAFLSGAIISVIAIIADADRK